MPRGGVLAAYIVIILILYIITSPGTILTLPPQRTHTHKEAHYHYKHMLFSRTTNGLSALIHGISFVLMLYVLYTSGIHFTFLFTFILVFAFCIMAALLHDETKHTNHKGTYFVVMGVLVAMGLLQAAGLSWSPEYAKWAMNPYLPPLATEILPKRM